MDTLLQIGLGNALVATFLALLVAAISKTCRRPALMHTLWLLVLLKLVTPSPLPLRVDLPAPEAAIGRPDALANSGAAPDNVEGATAGAWIAAARDMVGAMAASLEGFAGPVLLTLWVVGSVLWFTLAGVRSYRFARLLRFGSPARAELQDQAQRLAEDLGLQRCPRVWLMPGMLSPMLWGLGRWTRLLLPADLLGRLDPEQVRTLLAHELAHARRRDPWVRVFELLVLGLYWWHPVAWWARRRLHEVEEQCCDAWVVWALPAEAPSYATALIETVAFLSTARPALPPVASGVGYVHVLKQRLTLILCGTPPKGVSIGGLLAVMGLGLVLLPWRPAWGGNEPADSPPAQEEPQEAVHAPGQPEAGRVPPPVQVALATEPNKEIELGVAPAPQRPEPRMVPRDGRERPRGGGLPRVGENGPGRRGPGPSGPMGKGGPGPNGRGGGPGRPR